MENLLPIYLSDKNRVVSIVLARVPRRAFKIVNIRPTILSEQEWDSYHETWFYGYTGYFLPVYNSNLKTDLPVYLSLLDASRYDGVSAAKSVGHGG